MQPGHRIRADRRLGSSRPGPDCLAVDPTYVRASKPSPSTPLIEDRVSLRHARDGRRSARWVRPGRCWSPADRGLAFLTARRRAMATDLPGRSAQHTQLVAILARPSPNASHARLWLWTETKTPLSRKESADVLSHPDGTVAG